MKFQNSPIIKVNKLFDSSANKLYFNDKKILLSHYSQDKYQSSIKNSSNK